MPRSDSTARRDLPGQRLGHLGRPQPHDGDLALEVGVLDPVVEAAALEGVVHVAGAVRGDDHDRRRRRRENVPQLGNRDLVVGEHLEQERLELVVGPVDLVDQQDRRRPLAVVDGPQQRAAHEEALGVQLVLQRVGGGAGGGAGRPRRRAGAGAGGSSPTRRRPGWRRCPRSTGGGCSSPPVQRASTLATSVLPTPGLALEQQRPVQRRARKIAVASPSSAR